MDTLCVEGHEAIVFGGGCFWCTEAVFSMLEGVSNVTPGYAGGEVKNPTYEQVSGGESGHAEVVKVCFDAEMVSLDTLLTIFFASHDPTQQNRQGADVGEQYRSVIFFTNDAQKSEAELYIKKLNTESGEGSPVVTKVGPLEEFYEAEGYHKEYYQNNKMQPYCMVVINPKLKKVQKRYSDLLKEQYKK
jgi:peptide-methionine (S)-S-oxide reductase